MDMGGMGSSTSAKAACKISMLWNWNTVDSCFLASSWHIRSKGMFAGSAVGVFLLVIAIEGVRRAGREYDRYITQRGVGRLNVSQSMTRENKADAETALPGLVQGPARFTPSWPQQVLRGIVYGSQFTASFLVMLLGMYYNGYILFAIFIGHAVGYIAFGRDTVGGVEVGSGHCC